MFPVNIESNGFSAVEQEELEVVNGGEIFAAIGFAIGFGLTYFLTSSTFDKPKK